ncbi:nucleotidyl transferase AbiEii/AbiGii toxin family protein [Cupriavidus alkaliphilus]|uniref:Putative nucleotidyltransferase n=1 Tax=Cupriavidus alkaliphilus TaxID=942866 RepID=A0A7W4V9K7_9BURK|nr:nucleotidyl transferase AbiEii/AbiGii toxin family protein [Cupriavidus alkaliphilus]MBB3007595.1 putative nucleotidyltransferase [Cupriavidus alkaliphilus]PVY70532.1 putative nucleotidyltransferase [Cupriavidus alkaliphilus]
MPILHEIPAARPIDAESKALLGDLDAVARQLGISYFVGGATARQVILENVFGNRPARRTYDIDIGICIADWAEHEALRRQLVATGRFQTVDKNAHKLTYHLGGERVMVLDIIPFGAIERPAASIAWPPAMDTVMNVAGFRQAFDAAIHIVVDDGLTVAFVSLPGLAMLKLLAWHDRHRDDRRDATDLLTLLCSYEAAGNQDRLYQQEAALLEQYGFDLDIAAAGLLARDAAALARGDDAVTRQLVAMLGDDIVFSRLLEHMAFGDHQPVHGDSLDPKRVYPRMHAFRAEFLSMLGSNLS